MTNDDRIVVTLRDISEAAGISVDGARRRAKRRDRDGVWRILPSNHPQDPLRIDMPRQDMNDIRRQQADTSDRQDPDDRTPTASVRQDPDGIDHQVLAAMQCRIDDLRDDLDRARRDIERERSERQRERERADKLATEIVDLAGRIGDAERDRVKAMAAHDATRIDAARVRTSADAEIAALRGALVEMQSRPWWRRIVG